MYHKVQTPQERISVTCDDNATLYLLHSNDTVVAWEEPVYTVSTPSDQAKFLCILEEEVVEVHYVIIKGMMMIYLLKLTYA